MREVTILVGDVRERLADLKDNSVQCIVTSPPYYGLRDYGIDGQIGLEKSVAEWLEIMVDVFRECRRVLRKNGSCWVNIGDTYWTDSPVRARSEESFSTVWDPKQTASRGGLRKTAAKTGTFKNKDLMMMPARLAIALHDDGWYIRSDIIWAKPNPMPESAKDRPTTAHEHIFLLSKKAKYYFDGLAIATVTDRGKTGTPSGWDTEHEGNGTIHPNGRADRSKIKSKRDDQNHDSRANGIRMTPRPDEGYTTAEMANARNVWTIPTQGFRAPHFATFPEELARRCIAAGTKPGDTVLDPFAGAGTTLLVANRMDRVSIGIELNPRYAELARARIDGDAPMLVQTRIVPPVVPAEGN